MVLHKVLVIQYEHLNAEIYSQHMLFHRCSALGFLDITSPTFVISRIHKGKPNFIHIDAYRLLDSDISNFTDLDFESYLPNSIFVIEWGAPFVTTLTDQYLDINIKPGENENTRNLVITAVGDRWQGFNL